MSECILLNNMKNTKDSSLNTQKRMPHAEGYQNKNKLNQSIKNINKVKVATILNKIDFFQP